VLDVRGLLLVLMTFTAACTYDAAPAKTCRADSDCANGACRDGVCIAFATPLDEPVDPSDPPDASAVDDAGDAGP
jgi:hypothetical protein